MSHDMPAIGGGFVWPDLAFQGSDGSQILAVCKSHIISEDLSPIRYLNNFSAVIDTSLFENSVSAFVETVLARLHSCGIRNSKLHDLWSDLQYERESAKAFSHRKLEALLGLDPDEDGQLISSLSKWSKLYGKQALEEISASTDKTRIADILKETKATAQGVKSLAEMPSRVESSILVNQPVDTAPWQQGQAAAYTLRKKWQLGSQPISDETLADRLSITPHTLLDVKEKMPFSFAVSNGSKLGFILNRSHSHGRRFDTARLIGDHVGFDLDEMLRPATGGVTTRQQFQRAFAAEFLCPSEMIRERFSGKLDQGHIGDVVAGLSADYDVSEQLIFHHMQNRNVLPAGISQALLLCA
jgi:hypothetical protein